MNRRDFLKVAAVAALVPVPTLAHEPKPESELTERCPRCGLGYDTDGDGDCAVCARLPIIGGRTVEVKVPRAVLYNNGFTPEEVAKLREQINLALRDPDYSIVTDYQIRWDDVSDHLWETREFSELKVGDIFRLREEDGTIVQEGTEHEVSIVVEPPQLTRIDGGLTWGVRCDPWPAKPVGI